MVTRTFALARRSGALPIFFMDANPFYPIDGLGLGNDGDANNNFFTVEMRTTFARSGGEQLLFGSSDDLFVYIQGRLALSSLAGLHPRQNATLDVDAFASANNLALGAVVQMNIFFAHRSRRHAPQLRIEIRQPASCTIQTAGTRVRGTPC